VGAGGPSGRPPSPIAWPVVPRVQYLGPRMPVETTTLVRYYEATVTHTRDPEMDLLGALWEGATVTAGTGTTTPPPLAATFVSFPWAPPGAREDWWRDPGAVAALLDVLPRFHIARTDELASCLATALVGFRELPPGHDYAISAWERNAAAFAEQLVDAPVIPIEESPLSGASLAQLMSRAPDAAGALLGIAVGHDHPLLLVITVPAGIVIVGAATGVAQALNTGLRAKILGWMGVPDPLQLPTPGTAPPADEPSA
jgi:hypothetical protein